MAMKPEGKGTRIEGSEAAFEMEQARGEKAQPQEQKLDQKGAGGQPKCSGRRSSPIKVVKMVQGIR